MRRAILHVDMDAFYASIEQRDDPSLRGKPVAVGGAGRRSVVCAASYEARPFGVRSAMPMVRALTLCKELVVVPPDFKRYSAVSDQIFAIFHSFTPEVEGLSLDEAFLDVTRSQELFGTPRAIGEAIQKRVREELRLSCAVGISEVKFAAKIASDVKKPGGLTEIPEGCVSQFLSAMPVGRLWGVGPKMGEQLEKLRLRTIGDVARADRKQLERDLGSSGPWLHDLANGIDDREVVAERAAKSIGAEETFEDDLVEPEELLPFLHEQSLRVAARMRRSGLRARTVTLKIKFADFQIANRQISLPHSSDDGAVLYKAVCALLTPLARGRPIRLTGVSASGLEGGDTGHATQGSLFEKTDAREEARRTRLNKSLDQIHARFGTSAVIPADLLPSKKR